MAMPDADMDELTSKVLSLRGVGNGSAAVPTS